MKTHRSSLSPASRPSALLARLLLLQTEVARRQLALLQGGARSTTPKTPRAGRSFSGFGSLKRWQELVAMQQGSSRGGMTGHASPLDGSSEPSLPGSKDVAAGPPGGCSPVEPGNGAAPCAAAGAAAHLQHPASSAGADQPDVTGPPSSLSAPGSSADAPAGARPPGKSPGWQVLGRHLSLQQPGQPGLASAPSADSNVAVCRHLSLQQPGQPGLASAPASADNNVALKLVELETQMGLGQEHGPAVSAALVDAVVTP